MEVWTYSKVGEKNVLSTNNASVKYKNVLLLKEPGTLNNIIH